MGVLLQSASVSDCPALFLSLLPVLQKSLVTPREEKRAQNFPLRRFALKA
jgi:hypothetical protein